MGRGQCCLEPFESVSVFSFVFKSCFYFACDETHDGFGWVRVVVVREKRLFDCFDGGQDSTQLGSLDHCRKEEPNGNGRQEEVGHLPLFGWLAVVGVS